MTCSLIGPDPRAAPSCPAHARPGAPQPCACASCPPGRGGCWESAPAQQGLPALQCVLRRLPPLTSRCFVTAPAQVAGHMASEAGCGEGGARQESRLAFVFGGVLVEAGFCEPPGAGVGAWAVQVRAGGMAEEVNVLGVEAVREAEALGSTEQAGLGREVRLLVEDIMEVVEVVAEEDRGQEADEVQAEEPEEKPEQQGQEEPGRGPTTARPPLEALEALQLELSSVNARARRAYSRLKRKNSERRKLHLDRRGAIIQSIPGFWAKAVSLML